MPRLTRPHLPARGARPGAGALVAAALAVVLTLAGCGTDLARDRAGTATGGAAYPRLTPTCPAAPAAANRTVTVAELNRVVAGLDLPLWQAGDIGASTRLPDGRIVWVFGDTVRATGVTPRIVANSMLVTSGLCTSQVETRDRGPVIPDRAEGSVHWPMSIATLARGRQTLLVVISARIRRGSSGAFDFTYLGSSATVFDASGPGVPQLRSQLDITPDSPDPGQVNWGSAMTVQGSWIYVYGTRLPNSTSFGRALYVARAPAAEARDRGTWRFWDGTRWSSAQEDAAAVLPAPGGVSQTLSVDVVDGRYVIVSKRDGDLGSTVYSWTSASPTGPWAPRRGVRAQFQDPSGQLRYAPLAHPGIRLADGRLLISISRNTTDFGRLLSEPTLGRPVFAEIDRP
ncbi:DUF4185 domain-containing protein [Pedococcus sp. KACC 23699]|uniref:DUF4185 domain-containing protein n=1 Tax=Pedococcus sp. KACC 23699 TaxID=3149228 RepID=A0AAU7JS89_9MICO